MKRKLSAIAGTVVAVALLSLIGVFFRLSGDRETVEPEPAEGLREISPEDEAMPSTEEPAAGEERREVSVASEDEREGPPGDPAEFRNWMKSRDWPEFEAWAAESLRAQFGRSIAETANQVSLMELRRYLKENFPEDWETKLDALLQRAFPDAADEILTTFAKMDRYEEWFEENKFDLAAMRVEEIEAALWEKREEIFAEDATEIWEADSESGHLRDLLEILEEAYDIPLEDRLQLFRSAVEEADADEANPLMRDKRHVMALAFLNMESVQDELREMSPEERADSLRHIRESMGFDEDAIEGMEEIDAERDRRWQNGLRYMEERDDLARDYDGAALEEELRFLRERYFGDEAKTIEAEEASGFFRFRRRRIYGRN